MLPLERIQRNIPDDAALVLWITELGERWGCVVRSQGNPIWQKLDNPTDEQLTRWRSRPASTHPLVWTHRSGRRSLVLGASAPASPSAR